MSSNLRAGALEGFICDSAGNIIRNANIVIRDNAPGGSNIVASTNSDDSGYFITTPLKNGTYDIYESGVKTSRTLHLPQGLNIQSWTATPDNVPSNLPVFTQMDETNENDINKFRYYIQIENDNIDIKQLDHLFPIYNFPINVLSSDWYNFSIFHGLNQDSRITSTRFDIEYYNPLLTVSDIYRRLRWVGIPAINFTAGSKLVLPLDYYSMCFNRINSNSIFTNNIKYQVKQELEVVTIYDESDNDMAFKNLADSIVVGDVVKLTFYPSTTTTTTTTPAPSASIFYGIFVKETAKYLSPEELQVHRSLMFKKLKNSNYQSTPIETLSEQSGMYIIATKYDGFFNGISNIGSSVNEKFTVIENIYAQDVANELYNYNDIPG
jgi:hypothetical protein